MNPGNPLQTRKRNASHPLFAKIFADCPADYPRALEQKFPRILERIGALWPTQGMSAYFEDLLLDKRGGRRGFPDDVGADIFRLYSTYEAMRRRGDTMDPWGQENAQHGVSGEFSAQDFGKAVESNDVRQVAAYLDLGMPVDIRLSNGWTPLMMATFNSCENAALLLLRRGACATVCDQDGYTPLHWAALNGFARVVPELLARGADVNACTRFGFSPLIQAASRGHAAVLRVLLDSGARIDQQDHEGWTALHKATSNGHLEACLILLDEGGNPDLPHKSGLTAVDIAWNSKSGAIRRLFAGARVPVGVGGYPIQVQTSISRSASGALWTAARH